MDFKEQTLLRQILSSQAIADRVFPYIKREYFVAHTSAIIFDVFQEFFERHRALPSILAIRFMLQERAGLTDVELSETLAALDAIEASAALDETQQDFVLEQTEKWCQDRAIYVALRKSVAMLDDAKATPHVIPDLLRDALAVTFDTSVGHDFLADAESRYEFYHRAEARIPFDLEVFNTMTKGGVPKKTLSVVLAGTNVGKSLFLVHMAAACLRMSKNVLYVTLEMAEERIAERIDANMMDVPIDDLVGMSKSQYMRKIEAMRKTSTGRLVIKEYPTASAHTGHFRALLQELRTKQGFVPDIMFVDYLSICASARVKLGASVNSYSYNKAIAEELRALAIEHNIPIFTAAQFNRDGSSATDPGLDKISESFAIAQTADFIIALTTSEELEKNSQIQVYTLKNRLGKRQSYLKFILGCDTSRMLLYETTGSAAIPAPTQAPPDFTGGFLGKPPSAGYGRTARRPLTRLKTSVGDSDSP